MNTLLAFILIFGTIVFFHELGHFLVAKIAGVKVFEFSLGFGPAIFRFKPGETSYSIRIIPLGGFVKLAGMDEADEEQENINENDPRSFNNKPLAWRMSTIAAGPLMNFLLAMVIFALYFGIIVVPPTVTLVEPESPAVESGIQPGDQFVAINDEKVDSTEEIIKLIQESKDQQLVLTMFRDNSEVQIPITPVTENGQARLGVRIDEHRPLPFFQSVKAGIVQTGAATHELIVALIRMISGQIEPEIAGPIGIFQVVGEFANQGLASILLLAAILNINLGLLNLLPVPVLDGGWLVILALEGVRGKPLKPEHRGLAQFIGLALLITLMLFATYKDIVRLDIF